MLRRLIQSFITGKKDILISILLLILMQIVSILLPVNTYSLDSYEGYYLYLKGKDYPNAANPGWHEDAQGLTHDLNNWFITQAGAIWKIPVTHDLNSVLSNEPGVIKVPIGNVPELTGYNHFGDPDYYDFNGVGYVFVSMECIVFNTWPIPDEDCVYPPPAIGVFSADDLSYVDHIYTGANKAWCAIDPIENKLYLSPFKNVTALTSYEVDWDALKNYRTLLLSNPTTFPLLDENGSSIAIDNMQGGAFSASGELFYAVAGGWDYFDSSHGIHVFDHSTGKRVQRSINGSGYFNFQWNPGYDAGEEPEGLTIWDLDDGRAPGISGQLHAIMVVNDIFSPDDVYLKHYTLNISVDKNYTGVENGTPTQPFNTVNEAINYYPAWDGAQIKIKSGSYPETVSTSERVRIISDGGISTIGQ